MTQLNLSMKEKQTLMDTESRLVVAKAEGDWGRGGVGGWS